METIIKEPNVCDPSIRWYFVAAMYRAVVKSVDATVMCQRRVFVVKAEDKDDAYRLGRLTAVAKEHGYLNGRGERIDWEFVSIENAEELFDSDISAGTEVYWQFTEEPECK